VVIKNWEPLVLGPALAMDRRPGSWGREGGREGGRWVRQKQDSDQIENQGTVLARKC